MYTIWRSFFKLCRETSSVGKYMAPLRESDAQITLVIYNSRKSSIKPPFLISPSPFSGDES